MAESLPSQAVCRRVIDEVAAAEGVEPTELPPLAGSIDPDALETLFDPSTDAWRELRFEYAGYTVHVDTLGEVRVLEH